MTTSDRLISWNQRWQDNRIGFHRPEVNHDLVEFYSELVPDGAPCTVLVPLSGKSVDMLWLYERGHTVIGIEGVTRAVQEFFEESGLKYTVSALGDGVELYQTADGRLRLYRADLFQLDWSQLPRVQAIWDRASFVAVEEADRTQYAALLQAAMAPAGRWLLSALQYVSAGPSGPPRSLTEQQIRAELQPEAELRCLARRPRSPGHRVAAKLSCTDVEENVYLISERHADN